MSKKAKLLFLNKTRKISRGHYGRYLWARMRIWFKEEHLETN